jgi:hypothetical protein
LVHLQHLIASDPKATKWHLMLDNLNIHQSESLVRWVAEREGLAAETLGVKGKSGIIQSMESRTAFLHDPTHQVVFYYTPKHACLHESRGNLAQYFGAQVAQTRQFPLAGRLARPHLSVYRVLQSHDGETHQVDFHRVSLIMEISPL